MKSSSYKLDPRPDQPLQITAARYKPDNPPNEGVTLILAHALGSHKETWAPMLEYLFDVQNQASDDNHMKILEAWSIECPNHGDSAILNEQELNKKFSEYKWSGWIYPYAMQAFLLSKPEGVDFSRRNLVGIGHSTGGNALTLLHSLMLSTELEFLSIILLDASLSPRTPARDHMAYIMANIVWNKRDTWPSRKTALKDLSVQPGFRNWHPAVLELFVEKGLRDHPASLFPEPFTFKGGVTLSCSRIYEIATHMASDHHDYAFRYLQQMYRNGNSVHLIHSKKDEFDGAALKYAQTIPDAQTQQGPRSVQVIERGGHMFVQTCPQDTAQAVWNSIQKITVCCQLLMNGSESRLNVLL